LTKGLAKRPRGKSILNTWSSEKDIQLKMPVDKMKQQFIGMDRPCKRS
jgi:hypothetical protein